MTEKQAQDNLQLVNFRLSPEDIVRLDRLAAKYELTRSQFLRNLILVGLDESEVWDKVGLPRVVVTVRKVIQYMDRLKEDIDNDKSIKA